MKRMTPDQRREAIVAAALDVAVRKGLASTTVRDVAAEMGTSSGLIHHYFDSMDEVLAAAFERVAAHDLGVVRAAPWPRRRRRSRRCGSSSGPTPRPTRTGRSSCGSTRGPRRPADRPSRRPPDGSTWSGRALLEATIGRGVAAGAFTCPDPAAAAWRILSLLDGLALQVVAHGTTISRGEVVAWATDAAERELGLPGGALA